MRIDGNAGWTPVAAGNKAGEPATGSADTNRIKSDVDTARQTALSALHNDRFRIMLEQVTAPLSSDAMMMLQTDDGGARTDQASVLSSYAENSE